MYLDLDYLSWQFQLSPAMQFWSGPGSAHGSAGLSHMSEASAGPLNLLLTSHGVGQTGSDGSHRGPWEREREKGSTQGFLRPRHTVTWHMVLLPEPISQSKSQGRPRQKGWGDGLYRLVGGAAKSHDKRCRYRKEWGIRAIFSIRLA